MLTRFAFLSAVILALMTVTGCRKEEPAKPAPAPSEVAKPEAAKPEAAKPEAPKLPAAVGEKLDVIAKLAKADAFDGTTDKIISKCPTCKLQMDGSSEHAAEVSGYTVYFCSEKCKAEFTKDTMNSINDLEIPGS